MSQSIIRSTLKILIKDRQLELEKNEDAETMLYDKEIIRLIKEHQSILTIEDILETLDQIGYTINLLNDDDGHWAFEDDGMQSIGHIVDRIKKENNEEIGDESVLDENAKNVQIIEFQFWVDQHQFYPSIRDALKNYLKTIGEN